jgi:hypothetical protein
MNMGKMQAKRRERLSAIIEILPEESLEESSPGRYPALQVSDKKVTRTKQDAGSRKQKAVLQKLRRHPTPLKIDNDKILAPNRP